MDKITITIKGVRRTPTWRTLQRMLREFYNIDGELTQIRRDDGGCAYRDPGAYTLTFTLENGDAVPVQLEVQRD